MEHVEQNDIEIERVENFDDKINGLCVCIICNNIFIQPVQCNNCKAHFCSSCIENWVSSNPGNCPLCKDFKKTNSHPLLNNLLSSLKIKCTNFPKCPDILEYDFLYKHEEKCKWNIQSSFNKEKKKVYSATTDVNNNVIIYLILTSILYFILIAVRI